MDLERLMGPDGESARPSRTYGPMRGSVIHGGAEIIAPFWPSGPTCLADEAMPATVEDPGEVRRSHNAATRAILALGARARSKQWRKVLRRDPCSYCGARADEHGLVADKDGAHVMTIDHIVPRSMDKGGRYKPPFENAAPACLKCNQIKGSKSLLEFLVHGGMWPRPTLRPATVLDALSVLDGDLASTKAIAQAMGRSTYDVGMELSRLRDEYQVQRVGKRWRLRRPMICPHEQQS